MERHKRMNNLIEKYLEGMTSLAEEKELKAYFSSEEIAPELLEYAPLFGFFASERTKVYQPKTEPGPQNNRFTWFGIAAGIAIIIGIFLFKPATQNDLGTIKDPELALQKTKEVLNFISKEMNQGKEGLVYLTEIENTKEVLITNN
jgi:hypothetical protein